MPISQPVLTSMLVNTHLEVPSHQHFCALMLTELETQMGKGT